MGVVEAAIALIMALEGGLARTAIPFWIRVDP
jgi:hypothetical protein